MASTKREKPVQRDKARGPDITGNLRDKRHGTYAGYNYNGCTCAKCREANRTYIKNKTSEYARGEVPDHVHGTMNGYGNYHCRCERCREACRLNSARRYAIKRGKSPKRAYKKVEKKTEWVEAPAESVKPEKPKKMGRPRKAPGERANGRKHPTDQIPEELREFWISPYADHGTISGYRYWGCRCALCHEAHNEAQRDYAQRRNERKKAV